MIGFKPSKNLEIIGGQNETRKVFKGIWGQNSVPVFMAYFSFLFFFCLGFLSINIDEL